MSTTNDEQAKYGEQPKEREPMLSDGDISALRDGYMDHIERDAWVEFRKAARLVRAFYEHLITTGKLRVVEEVDSCDDTGCSKCGHYTEDQYGQYSFCPGCGNKIKR